MVPQLREIKKVKIILIFKSSKINIMGKNVKIPCQHCQKTIRSDNYDRHTNSSYCSSKKNEKKLKIKKQNENKQKPQSKASIECLKCKKPVRADRLRQHQQSRNCRHFNVQEQSSLMIHQSQYEVSQNMTQSQNNYLIKDLEEKMEEMKLEQSKQIRKVQQEQQKVKEFQKNLIKKAKQRGWNLSDSQSFSDVMMSVQISPDQQLFQKQSNINSKWKSIEIPFTQEEIHEYQSQPQFMGCDLTKFIFDQNKDCRETMTSKWKQLLKQTRLCHYCESFIKPSMKQRAKVKCCNCKSDYHLSCFQKMEDCPACDIHVSPKQAHPFPLHLYKQRKAPLLRHPKVHQLLPSKIQELRTKFELSLKLFCESKNIKVEKFINRRNILCASYRFFPCFNPTYEILSDKDQQIMNMYQNGTYCLPVQIRYSEISGWGVYSTRKILKDQFLGFYSGFIVQLGFAMKANLMQYALSFTQGPSSRTTFVISPHLDSWSIGPVYKTQARHKCNANIYSVMTLKGPEFFIKSARNIQSDQQIFWDYNSRQLGEYQTSILDKEIIEVRELGNENFDSSCININVRSLQVMFFNTVKLAYQFFHSPREKDVDQHKLLLISDRQYYIYTKQFKREDIINVLTLRIKNFKPSHSKYLVAGSSIEISTRQLVQILEQLGIQIVRLVKHGMKINIQHFDFKTFDKYMVIHPNNRFDFAMEINHNHKLTLLKLDKKIDQMKMSANIKGLKSYYVLSEETGTISYYFHNFYIKIYNTFIHNLKKLLQLDPTYQNDDLERCSYKKLKKIIRKLVEFSQQSIISTSIRIQVSIIGPYKVQKFLKLGRYFCSQAFQHMKNLQKVKIPVRLYQRVCQKALQDFKLVVKYKRQSQKIQKKTAFQLKALLFKFGWSSYVKPSSYYLHNALAKIPEQYNDEEDIDQYINNDHQRRDKLHQIKTLKNMKKLKNLKRPRLVQENKKLKNLFQYKVLDNKGEQSEQYCRNRLSKQIRDEKEVQKMEEQKVRNLSQGKKELKEINEEINWNFIVNQNNKINYPTICSCRNCGRQCTCHKKGKRCIPKCKCQNCFNQAQLCKKKVM